MSTPKRLIVAMTGASGSLYCVKLLQILKTLDIETHLIMSKSAEITLSSETNLTAREVKELASEVHPSNNIAASIASGSFKTMGMIVSPCTVKTMSEIATGVTSNLISRAADVILKERRKLVLMVRETPLHTGHLRTMTQLSEMGAIIAPPVPAFYTRPSTLDDIVGQSVCRVLDLFDLDAEGTIRWGEDVGRVSSPQ